MLRSKSSVSNVCGLVSVSPAGIPDFHPIAFACADVYPWVCTETGYSCVVVQSPLSIRAMAQRRPGASPSSKAPVSQPGEPVRSSVTHGGNSLTPMEARQKATKASLVEALEQSDKRQNALISQLKHRDDMWTNKTHHLRDTIGKQQREIERLKEAATTEAETRTREIKSLRQELARARAARETKTGELGDALTAKAGLADQMDTFLRRADEKIEAIASELEAEKEARQVDAAVRNKQLHLVEQRTNVWAWISRNMQSGRPRRSLCSSK